MIISAFGSAVLDECLLKAGLNMDQCNIGRTFHIEQGSTSIYISYDNEKTSRSFKIHQNFMNN